MLGNRLFNFIGLPLLAIWVLSPPRAYSARNCPQITSETITKLESYLDKQSIAAGDTLSYAKTHIISSDPVNNDCYRKLVFTKGASPKLRSEFLTPDQQYLSADLSNTLVDPVVELAAAEAAVLVRLKDGNVALGIGDPAAPFVVTVFEDYQCPYCRRLNDWIAALPVELKARTYVVSKNLPLPMHSWAKAGARLAVCAYRQSPEAFTAVRNVLFANQEALEDSDLLEQVNLKLGNASRVDRAALRLCYQSNSDADSQIERDVHLAATLEVVRTPTVFVNGKRLTHLTTYEALIAAFSATPDAQQESPQKAQISTHESAIN